MKFDYLVRDEEGETLSGTIEAPDRSIALETLQGKGYIVIRLIPISERSVLSRKIGFFNRVKRKEIFVFFRQLSILIEADVSLIQALSALSKQTENEYFKEILFEVLNDVDGGKSFSSSLAKHPKVFSSFAVNLVKTGEVSGKLQATLLYLAEYLEKEHYLISKVRGAMVYPIFILGAFLVVGVLVMVMVIPNLTSILLESGQALPLSTKIVIGVSDFVRQWGWILLIGFCAAYAGFFKYIQTDDGRRQWDAFKLKIPILGKILQKSYLARLADNLSALIKSGVPILQGISISANVIGNRVYHDVLFTAREDLKKGKNISSTLGRSEVFTPLFCQMIRTGEKTGRLGSVMEKLSEFYNKEIDNTVNSLSRLIEPILLVGLGLGVAVLIFAVFMPIYNLAGAI